MYYVYIVSNSTKTTLYTGVTNDLPRRLAEHRENRGNTASFAGKYYCHKLLYYEEVQFVNEALAREKEIKDMTREKKEQLIQIQNPTMGFLIY